MKNTVELKVEGMDCASCAANITRFLERKGLQDVYVNFSTGDVRYVQNGSPVTLDEVQLGIKKLGYSVLGDGYGTPFWTLERKLWVAAIFTSPLLLAHLFMMAGVSFLANPPVQFALCLPVFIIGFFHFGSTSLAALRNRSSHMDLLIFIGSTAAFIYSLVGLFTGESRYLFFETSASIITLVLLGNFMEKRAVKQTTTAIGDLSRLQVEWARKVMPSGTIVTIEAAEIMPGDWLQVNEGDKIPVDGTVLKGAAEVDESMLTGESLPVGKTENDSLIGGSVITGGNLTMAASATTSDSTLSLMIDLVKSAQQKKPDIQRLADRISAIFVPAVLGISAATFIIWYWLLGESFQTSLMNAIAVLVISCPSAMGLATPTAVMVGVGRLAKNGILMKGASTLEVFSKIKNFVFDKTGTLTTGQFKVKSVAFYTDNIEEMSAILLKMERHSSHPVAEAVARHLDGLSPSDHLSFSLKIKELKGQGVQATDDAGNVYKVGNRRFAAPQTEPSGAALFFSKNDQLMATLDLDDELKPDASALMNYLRSEGKTLMLLSGDREEKTAATARQLQISEWHAEKQPAEKLETIDALMKKAPTAMVGDGINDAAALARATIGISLSNASQVAMQSAQIILVNGNLDRLGKALAISKATLTTIKQNLFWAFAYNLIAIPVAMMGMLNPAWGALFMALSDVVVIGNSIRLKTRKIV